MADSPADTKIRGDEAGSTDEKIGTANVEDSRPARMQPPEFIRNLSPEEREHLEKKLKRKIDIRLLPAIIIMYIMNYIDRNNIAAARLAGLERDLNLTSTEFQTAVSILFVGYLLMQIPSNLFLNKFGKPAIYLPACMVVWGIISALTAVCTNAAGLLANRFFLGVVEAAYL
jgi:sugar phosphate permease